MAKIIGRNLFAEEPQNNIKPAKKPKIVGRNIFAEEHEEGQEGQQLNPAEETKGFAGIGSDIVNKIKELMSPKSPEEKERFLQEHAMATNPFAAQPNQEIPGFVKQVARFPMEALEAIKTGEAPRLTKNVYKGLENLGNIPSSIANYLGRKELINPEIGEAIHIPEHEMGLGEKQEGDILAQHLVDLLPLTPKGYKAIPTPVSSLEKAKQISEAIGEKHKEILGHGKEHSAHAAETFKEAIEGKLNPETGKTEGGLRKEVGSKYDKLAESMSKENVEIEVSPDIKSIFKVVEKLGRGVKGEERDNLIKVLSGKDSKKKVNGADALIAYREIKNQKNKANKAAYSPGISPQVHEDWLKKASELEKTETKMKSALEKQIGSKYLEKLKEIDKEYATKIAPLYKNRMYQEMLEHGQTSKNIIKFLHGSTPGNKTLKSIVEKNPELQKILVGQKHAANPEKLLEESEILEPYKKNPEIANIIEEQRHAKTVKEKLIPELEEAVKKAEARKNFRKGAYKVGAGGAGALLIEELMGGDWKKDIPLLAGIMGIKHYSKRK